MSHAVNSAISSDSLADILERVLDKGVVIAGDVNISLVGVELLTIRLRLVICSVEKAQELGINWWQSDPYLTSPNNGGGARLESAKDAISADNQDTEFLMRRIELLEAKLAEKGVS